MSKLVRKIAMLFMVCGLAVSVANAKCKDADGKVWDNMSAKDFMALESQKAKYEKLKKEVEEILQIYGRTREQAKDYDYVKFLNGLEMLQKSDRCIHDVTSKYGMLVSQGILYEYKDKNNDEYYFYGAVRGGGANSLDIVYKRLLGDDLSGELGELADKKLEAKQDSYSADIWLGK